MRLAEPLFLFLALAILPMWLHYRRRPAAVRFPSLALLSAVRRSRWSALRHVPFLLRCLAVLFLAVALARPQSGEAVRERTTEGLDIVLALDTSGSMQTRDYIWQGEHASRIQVIKSVITDFVRQRPSDRIGMVVFGTESFTQAPLTLDHEVLLRFIDRLEIGMAGDATAMGDGIATAVNRLKNIPAKSKIVILLTDGGSNTGRVDPLAAAQAAKTMGVKVYTVGVGADGSHPMVVDGRMQGANTDLDEEGLKKIAALTNSQYFRAADAETLVKVYETIDKLEKTKIKVESFESYEERYFAFAGLAGAFMLAELLVGLSRLRRIP